jgi:hypothetical protein
MFLAVVNFPAVATDFPNGGVSDGLNIAHVDHGPCETLEEGILAPRELVDDRCRGAPRLG